MILSIIHWYYKQLIYLQIKPFIWNFSRLGQNSNHWQSLAQRRLQRICHTRSSSQYSIGPLSIGKNYGWLSWLSRTLSKKKRRWTLTVAAPPGADSTRIFSATPSQCQSSWAPGTRIRSSDRLLLLSQRRCTWALSLVNVRVNLNLY